MRRAFAVVGMVAAACGGSGAGAGSSGDGGGSGGMAGAAVGGSGGSGVCAPGQQVPCACGGAVVGYQVCNTDGTGYDQCVCPDAGGTGGLGGTDAGVDAAPDATAGTGGGISIGGTGGTDAGGCATAVVSATQLAPYVYVMLDKSSSMIGFKWDATKTALTSFVNAPASAGINIAYKVFPRAADSTPVCDQTAYKNPDTPFGLLPGGAAAFSSALATVTPDGLSTPVYPALGGAVLKGAELAQANAGHSAALVLVIDGLPQGPAATCSGVDRLAAP